MRREFERCGEFGSFDAEGDRSVRNIPAVGDPLRDRLWVPVQTEYSPDCFKLMSLEGDVEYGEGVGVYTAAGTDSLA